MKKLTEKEKRKAIDAIAEDGLHCFVNGAVTDDNRSQKKKEGLGIRLSQHYGFDGVALAEVFCAALEDSNFHAECSQIKKMFGTE